MTEKQLISKIKELRQIRPREDWVLFTKKEILEKDSFSFFGFLKEIQKGERFTLRLFQKGEGFIFQHKPAFATLLTIAILLGLFGFTQNSLPGDALFSLKKMTEKGRGVFVSQAEKPKVQLKLASKRLEELVTIAGTNQTQKLAPAINEFQASISQAAQSLAKAEPKKDPEIVKAIVLEVKKLEEETEKIKSLGVEIGESEEELGNALAKIVEIEIKDLEGRTLTEKQKEILDKVKKDYEEGNYSQALEGLLTINQ